MARGADRRKNGPGPLLSCHRDKDICRDEKRVRPDKRSVASTAVSETCESCLRPEPEMRRELRSPIDCHCLRGYRAAAWSDFRVRRHAPRQCVAGSLKAALLRLIAGLRRVFFFPLARTVQAVAPSPRL